MLEKRLSAILKDQLEKNVGERLKKGRQKFSGREIFWRTFKNGRTSLAPGIQQPLRTADHERGPW